MMVVAQAGVSREMAKEGHEGETVKMLLTMLETGVMISQQQMIGITRSTQDLLRTQKYLRLRPESPTQSIRSKGGTLKTDPNRLPKTNNPLSNLKLLGRTETLITLIVLSMGQHNMTWRPVNNSRPLRLSSSKVHSCLNKPYLRRPRLWEHRLQAILSP